MFYVVIEGEKNAFYDTAINTDIPAGALEISANDREKFFSNNGKYIFINNNGVASLIEYTQPLTNIVDCLHNKYENMIKTINNQILLAFIDEQTELVKELKTEKNNILTEYKTKLEVAKNE